MAVLLVLMAAGVAFGTCLWSSRIVGLGIGAAVVAVILQLLFNFWLFPTLGFFYVGPWLSLIVAGVVGALLGVLGVDEKNKDKGVIGFMVPTGLIITLLLVSLFSSTALFRSGAYRELIGPIENRVFSEDVSMIDIKHIRLVPQETALTLAKKVLGQAKDGKVLGSQLEIDVKNSAIQEVNGELWWIFPLDFSGIFQWNSLRVIPGYIRVSAQDPTREAQLIDRDPQTGEPFQLRYTPHASFGARLDRKVYNAFPTVGREEYTLEVNESWRPYYVISVTYPTIGFGGRQTAGVIIADPQTGELSFTNAPPAWVDRVKPLNQALHQVKYWGTYIHGWWNTVFANRDIQVPTHFGTDRGGADDMWFVMLEGKKYWYTGMTSINSKDQSMVGMMFVETRSTVGGKAIYYPMTGTDENGVDEAVDSALGADSVRWNPSQPIPYNIYGVPTWVVPVVSREGVFQRVALVHANNINTLALDSDLERALGKYRLLLSQHGNELAPTETSSLKRVGPAAVMRVGDTVLGGDKTFLIMLEGQNDKLFSSNAATEKTRIVALVKAGDRVTIDFIETSEPIVPIERIQIEGIELKVSQVQSAYDIQREKSKVSEGVVAETRQAEEEWEKLTPEQKRDLIKKAKEEKEKK